MAARSSTPRPAHPRSRGENVEPRLPRAPLAGSSPLTRGKPRARDKRDRQRRLIPAHAGKTVASCLIRQAAQAHPRSRGENGDRASGLPSPGGSSPLTRGKRKGPADLDKILRLIPAHAGKTACADRVFQSARAHPRSRGENQVRSVDEETRTGSSPLTRGKPADLRQQEKAARLIPAHAGKTSIRSCHSIRSTAHPRSRGENAQAAHRAFRRAGSSPLTRGKHTGRVDPERLTGLIPAHAGKTLPDLRFYCADRSDLGNP